MCHFAIALKCHLICHCFEMPFNVSIHFPICAILVIYLTTPTFHRMIKIWEYIYLHVNSRGEITDFSDEYLVNGVALGWEMICQIQILRIRTRVFGTAGGSKSVDKGRDLPVLGKRDGVGDWWIQFLKARTYRRRRKKFPLSFGYMRKKEGGEIMFCKRAIWFYEIVGNLDQWEFRFAAIAASASLYIGLPSSSMYFSSMTDRKLLC